ncbi:MAG: DUF1353 domain-containing protein [Acidimicrobiia bacterium]
MPFTDGKIVVEEIGDERWQLVEPVTYEGNTDTFVVPAGFETDFASVPRVFVWLLPRYGKYTKAAILHDWLCARVRARTFDRADADGLFRRSMRELGVPFVRRWLMWAAVRWGAGARSLVAPGFGQLLLVLLVTAPAIVLFAAPVVVIVAAMALFWLVELLAFVLLLPFSHKRVNRPRFLWSTG